MCETERKMRAKLRVYAVIPASPTSDGLATEVLSLCGVAKSSAYPPDGSDEDNSFARWPASMDLKIHVANPNLVGTFAVGDTFYVDFIPTK